MKKHNNITRQELRDLKVIILLLFNNFSLLTKLFPSFSNNSSVTKHSAYPGFTVGLLGEADGGVGNTIFRISLHSEDNMMAAQ